jgi:hypothetical protein
MSNNNEQLSSPLVEESLSDTSINTPSIRGILKQQMTSVDKLDQQRRLSQLAKTLTIGIFIVVYAPIIAFNLYFAYTNNTSCVSYVNPIIGLSLYDYLTIQAYTMTFTLGLIVLDEFVDPQIFTRFKTFYDNYILCYRVFSIAWVSVGIILFTFITYKSLCSNGIYYYVAIVTGVLALSTMASIVKQYNDDYKLNNSST